MNKLWTLVGMSLAPAVAYYMRDKGAIVAIGAGLVAGWAINEYVLPSVVTAVQGATE